ncbi:MAG: formylmethanofuran dehydrogenase subunit C [Gemmataceae bacterium]|nr:formylmethanofuran dehydrogenase subunit C [Gemmataceae bacterium]
MGVTLTLRAPSPIPIEVFGVTPERVANLSAAEVAKLPVQHGNRSEPLGEFFDVTGSRFADLHFAGDTRTVKGIGAGMAGGSVYVQGDAGMHAGAGMTGGTLVIVGRAGDWLGAELRGGTIEVRGSVDGRCGAAYRGSRRGMTGGLIQVRGSAGDELGLLMRRGLIVIEGGCGAFAGASMIAGTIVVFGPAGPRLGAGMKRGTIVAAGGVAELPPSFAHACDYNPTFLELYQAELAGLRAEYPWRLPAVVRSYRGDLLYGGRGEVLVPVTSAARPAASLRG